MARCNSGTVDVLGAGRTVHSWAEFIWGSGKVHSALADV
jgi:hypothetical protein